jgi:Glyoxalase-like domain
MALARLASTALDCAEPAPLAQFWADLVGGDVAFTSEDFCAVRTGNGWLATVRVPDYRPPTWPDGTVPKQFHLDLAVDDLDPAEAQALRLGATKPEVQPAPDRWRVLLDPAGHPFCLSTQIPQ